MTDIARAKSDGLRAPPTNFWNKAIQENPQLEDVINAVTASNLEACVGSSKFEVVLGKFSGLAPASPSLHGAANMLGSPLPHLPEDGLFDIEFTSTTCVLTIKNYSGLLITIWNGVGTETGLEGSYSGNWVRL